MPDPIPQPLILNVPTPKPAADLNVEDIRAVLTTRRLLRSFDMIRVVVTDTDAATAAKYGVFFIAPFSCEVIECWKTQKAVGTDASAVTLDVEKLTTTQALDAGVSVLDGTFNLKTNADTPVMRKATSTQSNRILKSGDRLALKDGGVLTAVNHVVVTLVIRPIAYRLAAESSSP